MSWYTDEIPILVNYQGTHDPANNPKLPLGTDYSNTYTRNKSCLIYIGNESSEIAIGLKAFLKSFSITLKLEHSDVDLVEGKKHSVKNIGFSYSLEIILPAISVNDARVNANRLEMLEIMMRSTQYGNSEPNVIANLRKGFMADGIMSPKENEQLAVAMEALGYKPTVIPTEDRFYVLLSNLINNGNYTNKKTIKLFSDIKQYGLQCYIDKISYSAAVDTGFFEYDNKLWPKEFSLKLELIVPTLTTTEKRIIKPFLADGNIDGDEFTKKGSWPFGVSTK